MSAPQVASVALAAIGLGLTGAGGTGSAGPARPGPALSALERLRRRIERRAAVNLHPACGGAEGRARHHTRSSGHGPSGRARKAGKRRRRLRDRFLPGWTARSRPLPLPSASRVGQGTGRTARRAVARGRTQDPQPRRPRRLRSVALPPISVRPGSRSATAPSPPSPSPRQPSTARPPPAADRKTHTLNCQAYPPDAPPDHAASRIGKLFGPVAPPGTVGHTGGCGA